MRRLTSCWGSLLGAAALAVVLAVGVLIALMAVGQAVAVAGAAEGTVVAWGENDLGQLGDGSTTGPESCAVGGASQACSRTAVAVSGLSELSGAPAIAAGQSHSLVLLGGGKRVMGWGDDNVGQLGDGTTMNSDVPVGGCAAGDTAVPCAAYLDGVEAVSAGGEFSLALMRNEETVLAWGGNDVGQLGDGTITGPEKECVPMSEVVCSRTPVEVHLSLPLGVKVKAISAGGEYSLALLSNGTVMAWGANFADELGDGATTNSDVPVPVCVVEEATCAHDHYLENVKAVSAGEYHSLALLEDGTVVAWGDDYDGELGDGKETSSDVPVAVSGLSKVTAVSAGFEHSLALLEGGTVMAWGNNRVGQLGDGSTTGPPACPDAQICSKTPVEVKGLTGVTAVSAGFWHSLALLGNETVMAWGENTDGRLGDGATGPETCENPSEIPCSRIPVAVSGLSEVTAISAGSSYSLALTNSTTPPNAPSSPTEPSTNSSSPGGGSGGGSGTGGTGSAGGGGSSAGSTASVITPAELTALINAEITPYGKTARIASLLKSGGVTIPFKALEAGTALIGWYELPLGAQLAKKTKRKPVLVASGRRSFSAAGTATIKIELTATGKRLLKHSKQLELTAKGTFTPTGQAPVSATKAFVLKH